MSNDRSLEEMALFLKAAGVTEEQYVKDTTEFVEGLRATISKYAEKYQGSATLMQLMSVLVQFSDGLSPSIDLKTLQLGLAQVHSMVRDKQFTEMGKESVKH